MAKHKLMGPFLLKVLPDSVQAITLAPFGIYYKARVFYNSYTQREEETHWDQQMEMLIIFFYIWYVLEWAIKWLKYRKDAYSNISFEREAKKKVLIKDYLKQRRPFAWVYYINHKS